MIDRRFILPLTILVVSFGYHSCTHDPVLDSGPLGDIDTTDTANPDTVLFSGTPCDEDTIYFVNDILPFLSSTCAQPGCHDAATAEDGVILTDYSNIISTGDVEAGDPNDSDLYEVLVDDDEDDRMPPIEEDPLTINQIQMIFTWIAQGAQNNSCAACETEEVTYSNVVYPIVELKCQGCHSGDQPSSGLALMDYDDISAIALNESFYSAITATNGYTQMPYNANPLPDCEIDLILSWIEDGAPEN